MQNKLGFARGAALAMVGALAASTMTLAGAAQATGAGTVVARAGSIELSAADLHAAIALLPDGARTNLHANSALLQGLVRSELMERAILEDAHAHGFDTEELTREHLELARRKALANLWVTRQGSPPADYPSDAQINAAYEAARKRPPTEYHVAQIFVGAPDGISAGKLSVALGKVARLSKQVSVEDFAELARTSSEDPATAAKGGDTGFLTTEQMVPTVVNTVKGLQPGQVAGPIKTPSGFFFVKLLETRSASPPALASVRQSIAAELRSRLQRRLQDLYMSDLGNRVNIRIDEQALAQLQASLD